MPKPSKFDGWIPASRFMAEIDAESQPLRTCADCGRELFTLPGEGLGNGDDDLCTDCCDCGLDQEFVL